MNDLKKYLNSDCVYFLGMPLKALLGLGMFLLTWKLIIKKLYKYLDLWLQKLSVLIYSTIENF